MGGVRIGGRCEVSVVGGVRIGGRCECGGWGEDWR